HSRHAQHARCLSPFHPGPFTLLPVPAPRLLEDGDYRRVESSTKGHVGKERCTGTNKARIRAEVFNALDDQSEPRPPLSHENFLINELIREYLEYNKYKYTASVLTAESGQPEVPLDRQFLVHELNIVEDPNRKSVPLLYGIIAHFLHGSKGDIHDTFSKGSSLQFPRRNLSKLPNERNQMDSIPEPGRIACTSIEDPLF
uniref:Centrosomal protein 20 n=1 Tax=Gopherus evgoodei TaxID=1825980 RepID=A0A8C5F126_9SAUR